jgi:hypothetical protein
MSEWQPIETAPINVEIMLLDTESTIRIGRKYGDWNGALKSELDFGDYSATFYYPRDNLPTHWMPLPKPPEPKE